MMRLPTKILLIWLPVWLTCAVAAQSEQPRPASTIMPQETLRSDVSVFDAFGFAVSLSDQRALVGAFRDDENGIEAGAAYVFDFDGETWTEGHKLLPTDAESRDWFGYAVSLSGNRALVSAFRDDTRGSNSGSVFVFDFDGENWIQTHQLNASDGMAFDGFGFTVALLEDRALIGAPFDDDKGLESGAVYVFDFDGTDWLETQKLTAADGQAGDEFGRAVALTKNRLLVSATRHDALGEDSGAAYVFDYAEPTWLQSAKLAPANGVAFDQFGNSVSLHENMAMIGAQLSEVGEQDTGSAYAFEFTGSDWLETQQITAPAGRSINGFGQSVSVLGDRLLVSAYTDVSQGESSGSAYLYVFDGKRWNLAAQLSPETALANRHVGFSVSVSQDKLLIGGRFGEIGSFMGSAFVADLSKQPVAVNDAFVRINTTGRVRFDVLANDVGALGEPLSIEAFTQPKRGRIELFGSQLVYRARPGFCNSRSEPEVFSYTLSGGSTAEVELTLLCINPFD